MPPMQPTPPTDALSGRDIVCVGFADWNTELWTNQHHLMSRLARTNRVLFVESLGLRRPQVAARDVSRILRRLRRGLRPPQPVDGLHVLSPLVLPFHSSAAVRAVNARLLPALVGRASARLGYSRPILWSYVPQAEVLIEALDPSLVVYHCVDDISAHELIDTASFRAAEARFAGRADLVLASAPALAERMRELSENVIYAPNVADTDLFATALAPGRIDPEIESLPAPRILFTGAIAAAKLDIALLVELARGHRDWSIALVGPVGLGDPLTDVSALRAEPNIHLIDARPYAALPDVLRGADAGLIPYVLNELTASVFPMKVYEYLAAGIPVVTTPLPSLEQVSGIARAVDADGIGEQLALAIAEDSPSRRQQRSQAAAAHSWDARLAEIALAVEEAEKSGPADRTPSTGGAS
jgi:glycosyltransferase involved in cell wall biosynthesis